MSNQPVHRRLPDGYRADRCALGKRLAHARRDAGLTQAELGRALDLTGTHVSRLERGSCRITRTVVIAWAFVTGWDPDALIAGSQCACTHCAPGHVA